MKYRILGKTGFRISEVSLGAWQIGGVWGEPFDERRAAQTLHRAFDAGMNFIDTADVYSDGLSEKVVGQFVRSHRKDVFFATKCGRRLQPHTAEGYNEKHIRGFIEDSLRRMGLDCLDLVQLHCPPTQVYYQPEVFGFLDTLRREGKILHYGVSVEKIEEGLKALEYPGVASVQIIFNMFRQRPMELFFPLAKEKNVGIIARVPLASGLLSGKFTVQSTFGRQDHRNFNREGAHFDKGETFSGVDYGTGLAAVEELRKILPSEDLAGWAIRWILMAEEVSCVIPGASNPEQAFANAHAGDLPPLHPHHLDQIREVYCRRIGPLVHQRW